MTCYVISIVQATCNASWQGIRLLQQIGSGSRALNGAHRCAGWSWFSTDVYWTTSRQSKWAMRQVGHHLDYRCVKSYQIAMLQCGGGHCRKSRVSSTALVAPGESVTTPCHPQQKACHGHTCHTSSGGYGRQPCATEHVDKLQ